MFEILYTDNTLSKLTVAKNRTTLKIRKEDKKLGLRMIDMTERIVEILGEIVYTYRGSFMFLSDGRLVIDLHFTKNKTLYATFIEGE